MKKSIFCAILAICVTLAMMPITAKADPIGTIVAKNVTTGVNYNSLQGATNEAASGEVIQLQENVNESITIGNSYSFTIDLNSKTLEGKSGVVNAIAITHNGTGTLTISDNSDAKYGCITSAAANTILLSGGSLVITGGTVENTCSSPSYGYAVRNEALGSVSVMGGAIRSTGELGVGIYNFTGGSVTISGGTVSGGRYAVQNNHFGNITINGGTLSCTYNGVALMSENGGYTSTITINDGTICNDYIGNAIYSAWGTVNLNGGTIRSKNKIGIESSNSSINITQGPITIQGGEKAIYTNASLTIDASLPVIASGSYEGSPAVTFNSVNLGDYKYLLFMRKVTNLNLTGKLSAPVTGAVPESTITEDIMYTGTVSWSGSPSRFLGNTVYTATVTLTAKPGYTFDGVEPGTFIYNGSVAINNPTGTGNTISVGIIFLETAERTLQSIAVTTPPSKTTYTVGELFNQDGMIVRATYNDGSVNAAFTNYTIDKTGSLAAGDTTITLTAAGTGITTTQLITINKEEGPVVSGVSAAGCTNANNNDGRLTGVTNSMEYKKSDATDYIPGNASGEINGLTNGTYLVRVKETATHNPGAENTFTISAYVPSIPNNDTSYLTPTPIKEGKIEKAKKQDDNSPTANLTNSIEELKSKVLSATEQEQVRTGKDAKVILKITDISASVSEEEKNKIQQELAAGQQDTDVALLYVDISLYKQIGNEAETRVTQTSGKIKISIEIPEAMWNTKSIIERTYRVVRVHNGVTTLIDGVYDPITHLFTFETDSFSTYALTYQDSSNLQIYHDFQHLQLNVKSNSTEQVLSYQRLADADGYLIYGGRCGGKMTELAEVSADTTSYIAENLKKGLYYKYQIRAFQIIEGERVIIVTSNVVRAVTTSKAYADPMKVTVNKQTISLVTGSAITLNCKVVLPENKKMKELTTLLRYESTNKEVAIVDKKGKITAIATGTCYVYAYAQNGVCTKIKVTVK